MKGDMNKQFSCPNCGVIDSTITKSLDQVFPVKGEKIAITSPVRICKKCKTDIYDEELDSSAIAKAYNSYRTKHNIISPADIRALREIYGLTQRGLSALLGCGEITVHRYENGSIPDEVHNQLFKLIRDPINLKKILDERRHILNPKLEQNLRKRLNKIIASDAPKNFIDFLAILGNTKEINIYTGFKKFSPETLMEMMIFFANKSAGIFKTKINKLLWYSDFIHYRLHSVSISGASYVHLKWGPVPDNYDMCLSLLLDQGALAREEVYFSKDTVREKLVPTREPDESVFSSDELETMSEVFRNFRKLTSKQLSDLSHTETGYIKTDEGDPISYVFAENLKVKLK
jgi:putative zinc finger/helix-turn-helix YgiT family protein